MRRAMLGVGFPCALAKSIWLRRTVKPWDDRRPASSSACSFSVSCRTNNGACILLYSITCPSSLFGFALVRAGWALLGWEGWVKYPDGRHGHTPGGVMGTESIEQEAGETWEGYVQRSARFCAETIAKDQHAWDANPSTAHMTLYFCLTATPPDTLNTHSF